MRFLWIVFILNGLGAFVISLIMEGFVVYAITDLLVFSFCITSVFELAKVMTIVMHRYLSSLETGRMPVAVAATAQLFKAGLLLLSLVCSIACVSGYMDSPNLEKIRGLEKKAATEKYEADLARARGEYEKNRKSAVEQIEEKYKERYRREGDYYLPRIEEKERSRDLEFDRKIGGVRKGEKWNEHNRQAVELAEAYKASLDSLKREENREFSETTGRLDEAYRLKIRQLEQACDTRMQALNGDGLLDDDRVRNSLVVSLMRTFKGGLDFDPGYLRFTTFFSILISLLLELTIYVVFNFLVVSHKSIFILGHDLHLGREAVRARANDEFQRDKVRYGLFEKKVRHKSGKIPSTLKEVAGNCLRKDPL